MTYEIKLVAGASNGMKRSTVYTVNGCPIIRLYTEVAQDFLDHAPDGLYMITEVSNFDWQFLLVEVSTGG